MEKYKAYRVTGFNKTGSVTIICLLSKMLPRYLVADFTVLVSSFDDSCFQIPYIGTDMTEDENFKLNLRCSWKATQIINMNDDAVEFIKKMVKIAYVWRLI